MTCICPSQISYSLGPAALTFTYILGERGSLKYGRAKSSYFIHRAASPPSLPPVNKMSEVGSYAEQTFRPSLPSF